MSTTKRITERLQMGRRVVTTRFAGSAYKALRHKKLKNTYGTFHAGEIWQDSVPELFPSTTTINSLKELHSKSEWIMKEIDDYEMVVVMVEVKETS